jgi:tetratricopeptide (TPR) repeat protein
LARGLNDKRRLAETLHSIGAVQIARGRGFSAMVTLSEAFALAEELGDEALSVVPSFYAAFARMDTDPPASVALFHKAIALARKYGNREREAHALSAQGMALARMGRFAESRAALEAAQALAREPISPLVEADVYLFSGWAHLDMDDAATGLEHGRRGVDLALASDNVDCICGGMACVGFGHMQSGQAAEAASAFDEAILRSRVSGALPMEILASGGLAMLQFAEGQAEAVQGLEQAEARAREIDDPFTSAFFGQALAEAYLSRGDLAKAEGYLRPALEYFRRYDMGPYLQRALALEAALNEKLSQGFAGA